MHRNHEIDSMVSDNIPKHMPSTGTILKISLGLIFVAILSQAFAFAETMSVDVDGTSYDVSYDTDGVDVLGIIADPNPDFPALIFSLDVTENRGILEITFERSFFDAKYQGSDDEFILLADGFEEPNFTETKTDSSRTLTIELTTGTEELEIFGTIFGSDVKSPEPTEPVDEPTEEPTTPIEEPTEPVDEPTEEPTAPVDKPTEKPTTPVTEKPKTQCGEGTVLKDGVCVLEKKCGTGTILKDGVCVVVEQPKSAPVRTEGLGKQLGYGVIAAFIITGAIALVLALMSKASKSKH